MEERVLATVVCAIVVFGCESKSLTYLVPDGYEGAVIVAYGDPSAEPAIRDENGGEIYTVPPTGVLRLSTPQPPGVHHLRYFYVGRDGQRTAIPSRVDEDTRQVLAFVTAVRGEHFEDVGRGMKRKEFEGAVRGWTAFVIGVPSEREDWVEFREQATFLAIGHRSDGKVSGSRGS